MTDILIIGGGVIGLLTARELVLAGYQVSILDKSHVGGESSWAGGGIISPLYPWRYDDEVSVLADWSQSHYPELIEEIEDVSGLQAELVQSGLLILDSTESEKAQKWANKQAVEMHLIGNKEILNIEPALSAARIEEHAIWMPKVCQVRNPRLIKALKEYLLRKGVNIIEGREVTNFLIHNNEITGVSTHSDDIHAEKVLVAGGAWSAKILKNIGLSINVEPVKGQMLLFKAPSNLVSKIVLSKERYVIPRSDGRILVGSTLEYTDFDKSTTAESKKALMAEAISIIPELKNHPVEHHWAGLRPGSKKGIPYICKHPTLNNLFINTGHFRNGIVLGPASARLMADIIMGRETIVDGSSYECNV